MAKMRAALLVLHAPLDQTVGVENATRIFLAAKHPKSYVSLDDADHLLSNYENARYAADVIAAWAARYIDMRGPAITPPARRTRARATSLGGRFFRTRLTVDKHAMLADEPIILWRRRDREPTLRLRGRRRSRPAR